MTWFVADLCTLRGRVSAVFGLCGAYGMAEGKAPLSRIFPYLSQTVAEKFSTTATQLTTSSFTRSRVQLLRLKC